MELYREDKQGPAPRLVISPQTAADSRAKSEPKINIYGLNLWLDCLQLWMAHFYLSTATTLIFLFALFDVWDDGGPSLMSRYKQGLSKQASTVKYFKKSEQYWIWFVSRHWKMLSKTKDQEKQRVLDKYCSCVSDNGQNLRLETWAENETMWRATMATPSLCLAEERETRTFGDIISFYWELWRYWPSPANYKHRNTARNEKGENVNCRFYCVNGQHLRLCWMLTMKPF